MRKLAILTIFSLFLTPVMSQALAATSKTKKTKKKRIVKRRKKSKLRSTSKVVKRTKKKEESKLSLSLDATLNSNLHSPSSNEFALNTDIEVSPSYKIGKSMSLFGYIAGNKDFQGERKFELSDALIGGSGSIHKFEHISISGVGWVYIPISEASDISTLKSGIFLAPIFTLNMAKLQFNKFRFDFRPGFRLNFHEFETSLSGSSNTQYSLSARLRIHYTFTDTFRLTLSNTYSRRYTYLGNQSDSYAFSQTFYYTLNEAAELNFGHSKGGRPLAANGKDVEIEFFDSRSSNIFTGLSYGF